MTSVDYVRYSVEMSPTARPSGFSSARYRAQIYNTAQWVYCMMWYTEQVGSGSVCV